MNLSYILTGFSALHGSAGGDIVSIPTQDTVKNESEVVSGYQPGTWTVDGYTSQWLNMKFEARSAFEITEDRIESTTKKNEAKKQDNPNAQTTEMVFYSLDYKYYYEDSEVIGLYVQPVVDKNKTLEAYADENLQSSFHIYEEYDNEYTLLENTNSHVEFLGQSWLLHHHKILDSDLNSVDEEYSFFRIQDNYLVQLMILGSGETTYQMDLRDILTCFSALNGAGQANNTQSPLICSHDYTEATCLKPQTCTICGDTIGSALEHQWENATCETPETCNRCGATTGDAAGHKWKSATCTEPERCTVCEETGAEAQGHSMLFTKCSRSSCDYIDYSCIAGTYTNIGGYGVPVGTTKMVDIDVTNVSVSNSGELSFTYNGKNYTLTVKQNNKGDKFMMYFDCYLDGVLVDNVNFRAGNELYDNRIYLGEFIADGCAIYLNATK